EPEQLEAAVVALLRLAAGLIGLGDLALQLRLLMVFPPAVVVVADDSPVERARVPRPGVERPCPNRRQSGQRHPGHDRPLSRSHGVPLPRATVRFDRLGGNSLRLSRSPALSWKALSIFAGSVSQQEVSLRRAWNKQFLWTPGLWSSASSTA